MIFWQIPKFSKEKFLMILYHCSKIIQTGRSIPLKKVVIRVVVFREVTSEGNFTGRIIQWHPGDSTYHGPDPYWKVSTGEGGTVRIGGENFKE